VQTPRDAIKNGADFIVVGRPVIASDNPIDVVQTIYRSLGEKR
jgi:orotidine-5'-phosphate decarboxylase